MDSIWRVSEWVLAWVVGLMEGCVDEVVSTHFIVLLAEGCRERVKIIVGNEHRKSLLASQIC